MVRLSEAISNVPVDESAGEWYHSRTHHEKSRADGSNTDSLVRKLRFPYNISKIKKFVAEFAELGKTIVRFLSSIVTWRTQLQGRAFHSLVNV